MVEVEGQLTYFASDAVLQDIADEIMAAHETLAAEVVGDGLLRLSTAVRSGVFRWIAAITRAEVAVPNIDMPMSLVARFIELRNEYLKREEERWTQRQSEITS